MNASYDIEHVVYAVLCREVRALLDKDNAFCHVCDLAGFSHWWLSVGLCRRRSMDQRLPEGDAILGDARGRQTVNFGNMRLWRGV
ncbi:hypothetical protein [Mesorhizobium sp. URHB0026]